uniref:Uncharacterized protein n=1 Tax=Molossus molossus TaxID=27622 RepID=A0A7J8GRV0_MOLMO|nr:hypothetical protein HJG59_011366 [Molossus molossus]
MRPIGPKKTIFSAQTNGGAYYKKFQFPKSVSLSSEIDKIVFNNTKHHKIPMVGRSCVHHWIRPQKSKSTGESLPQKVLSSGALSIILPTRIIPNNILTAQLFLQRSIHSCSVTNQVLARNALYKLLQRYMAMDILVAAL